MTDSSSEPTYSWAKRVNDNKGLFESAGAIAKQALESSQQVSAAGSAAEKGLTEKIHGGFAKARIAITAVDALCKAIFGYSPVDEWIKKPFFGDWDDLRATANQWRALAESLSALQGAVRNVSSNVDETSWSGKAADLFVIRNNSLAETAGKGPQPCLEVAQALEALADEVDGTFDMVMDGIELLIELLAADAAEFSIPVVGPLVGTAQAAVDVGVAIDFAVKVTEYIATLLGAIADFVGVASTMVNLTSESQSALDQFCTGSGGASGGSATAGGGGGFGGGGGGGAW